MKNYSRVLVTRQEDYRFVNSPKTERLRAKWFGGGFRGGRGNGGSSRLGNTKRYERRAREGKGFANSDRVQEAPRLGRIRGGRRLSRELRTGDGIYTPLPRSQYEAKDEFHVAWLADFVGDGLFGLAPGGRKVKTCNI
jgi:hypothetical protein